MKLSIPPKVVRILDTLNAHGYEGYAVGGCIRDTILDRNPNDWDITTSARPQEVKLLFPRTVDTGLQHGTVTVLFGSEGFEVTTYRIDGTYEDHRHPTQVEYASQLSEDLRRRDFTINAMAYNRQDGLVDLFGGMEDLQRKVIRCVGDPWERFSEDALRILRAVRFSAQLGFTIETKTLKALQELAPTLVHVSKERIQAELIKLLTSNNPHYVKILEETGILQVILPELSSVEDSISEDQLKHLRQLPPDKGLRLACLLLPLGEKKAVTLLRGLKFDNDTMKKTGRLIRWYYKTISPDDFAMRQALYEVGDDLMEDLLTFQSYDRPVEKLWQIYRGILERGECYQLKQLKLTGKDLLDLGIRPGQEIGRILQDCLALVIEEPNKNHKETLIEYVKNQEHLK